jgi:hypothetical protein
VILICFFPAILADINRKFKYRHNTEFRLLNDLKVIEGEQDVVESPRRKKIVSFSGEKAARTRLGRPCRVHEDWLRSNGKTLSFVDNDGVVSLSMSPPKQNYKGDGILYMFLCVYD